MKTFIVIALVALCALGLSAGYSVVTDVKSATLNHQHQMAAKLNQ